MQFTNEIIGARLLETITAGLYDGNLNCVREYVQNSIDEGAKNVEIFLENGNTLVIYDDGPGMDESALKKALSIGISSKEGDQIGWRGLGIWSGASASKRIVILSKMQNKPKIRMEIDNDVLRSASQSNEPITDILTKATSEIEEVALGKRESLEDDHFTSIRLETILPNQRMFFSDNQILRYLQKIVPAPFDLAKFPRLAEVNNYLIDNGVTFPNVEIRYNNEKIYRHPCNGEIYYEQMIPYKFVVEENIVAIGWFFTAKDNKELEWPNGGVFFKKKGMTIGDEGSELHHN